MTPDQALDRSWAMTLLGNAVAQLEAEFKAAGKSELFQVLKPLLAERTTDYADLARKLNTTPKAMASVVLRVRQRYRDLIRAHVAQTLASPTKAAVDEEVRHLLSLVGG